MKTCNYCGKSDCHALKGWACRNAPIASEYHHETVCREKELKAEVDRLRDIIRRASVAFCRDGSDAATCSAMFHILSEAIVMSDLTDESPAIAPAPVQ